MRTFILFTLIVFSSTSFANNSTYADLIEGKFSAGKDDSFEKDVYANPDAKSQVLGKLKFYYSSDVIITKFVSGDTDKMYEAPYLEGRCGDSKFVFSLTENPTMKNGFTNLGEGPWGKAGWAKAKVIDTSKAEFEKLAIPHKCHPESQASEIKVQPPEEKDLFVIDLVPKSFNDKDNYKNCLPINQNASTEGCQIYDEKCNYTFIEEKTYPPVTIETKNFNGNVLVEIPDVDLLKIADKKDKHYSTTYLAPDSDSIIYLVSTGPLQQVCFGNCMSFTFKNGPTEISQHKVKVGPKKIEIQKTNKNSFEVVFVFNKGNSVISSAVLSMGGYPIETMYEGDPITLKLEKGTYRFQVSDSEHKLKFKREVKVTGDEKHKLIIQVKGEDMKQELSNRFLSESNTAYKFNPINIGRDKGAFKSVKVFRLNDKNREDVTKFFAISDGILISTHEGYNKLKENQNSNRLEIEGICTYAKHKPLVYDYKLFSGDKAKEIGHLNAIFTPDDQSGTVSFQFVSPANNKEKFEPNWENKNCKGKHFSSHFVVSTSGGWSDLGVGPWGVEAWVQLPASKVEEMGRRYDSRDMENSYLRRDGENYILENFKDEDDSTKLSLNYDEIRAFRLSTSCGDEY